MRFGLERLLALRSGTLFDKVSQMQTYAHYFWTYVIFRKKRWVHQVAAFSIFPDMPYFMVYLATLGKVGSEGRSGFREGILYPIANATHSLSILGIAALVFILLRKRTLYPMLIGWFIHQLGDHLTHVIDTYPLFWPISMKRFPAFVSYWDPEYYGREFFWVNHLAMMTISTVLIFSWAKKSYRLKRLKAEMDSQ